MGPKKIFILARRVEQLERVKKECESLVVDGTRPEIEIIKIDLADSDKCYELAKNFTQQVDILVNNGGLSNREEVIDCKLDICKHMMEVNCMSPIALIKGFIPMFLKSKDGAQVVNILSVAG